MYLYYDVNGVLKEIINDLPLRQSADLVNRVYVYTEATVPNNATWTYRYKLPSQAISIEYSFESSTSIKQLPYDRYRDLKYFEYGVNYTFHYFDVPSAVLAENGAVAFTFRAYTSGYSLVLEMVTFNVESSVVAITTDISQSQFAYLLEQIAEYRQHFVDLTANTFTSRADIVANVSELNTLYLLQCTLIDDPDLIQNNDANTYLAFIDLYNESVITLIGSGVIVTFNVASPYTTIRRSATKAELATLESNIEDGTITAYKANRDGDGLVIASSYGVALTLSYSGGTNKITMKLYSSDNTLLDTKEITLPLANSEDDGLMSSADKTKLDALPTNAELLALLDDKALISETGNKLATSYDAETGILTIQLLDKNDNVLSTQTEDLPLELIVESGEVVGTDLILTLANGETITIPIGSLITKMVETDSNFTTDENIVVVDGTGKKVKQGTKKISDLVPTSRTIAGKALTSNITLAKGDVGLGNVDNTSDANKPISAPQLVELNKKANTDGYYAQLHSGLADNLASPDGITDTDGYAFRTSAGSQSITDGYAELKKILGNTVVWNQKVQNGNFTSTSNWSCSHATGSVASGIYTAIGNDANDWFNVRQDLGLVLTHIYYVSGEVMTTDSDATSIRVAFDIDCLQRINSPSANTWYRISYLKTGSVSTTGKFEAMLYHATSANGKTLKVRNCFVIDLTLMFGAGNEPVSASAVELLLPQSYYAYSLPTLKSVIVGGIKTVGFNLFNGTYAKVVAGVKVNVAGTFTNAEFALSVDGTKSAVSLTEETINDTPCHTFTPTYSGYLFINGSDATTCVSNVWSGYRVGDFEEYWTETRAINSSTYFPNGMRGVKIWNSGVASEVRDELLPDKYIKRFEIVDLGTLTWFASASGTANERQGTLSLSGIVKQPSVWTTKAHIVTNKYVLDTDSNTYSHVMDKTISIGGSEGRVYVYDSALIGKTNAEIKTAMSGVYLIYELATPVETAITPELPFTYKISDFGTEEWLELNTPVVDVYHETFYMSNLRDAIRRLPLDYYDKDDVDTLLAGKVDKAQNGWTSVDLLNGHTGTLKIRKDNFGNVVGILDITTPNPFQAQAIAVLPEGFGPQVDETRYFRRSSGGDLIVWISASARTFNAFAGSSAGVTIKGSFTFIKE